MHNMESRKIVQMNLFAGQEQRCRRREWACGHKEGGMDWEMGIDVCMLIYVK